MHDSTLFTLMTNSLNDCLPAESCMLLAGPRTSTDDSMTRYGCVRVGKKCMDVLMAHGDGEISHGAADGEREGQKD